MWGEIVAFGQLKQVMPTLERGYPTTEYKCHNLGEHDTTTPTPHWGPLNLTQHMKLILVSLSLSPQLKPQLWLRKPLLSTHPPPSPPTNQK